MRYQLLACDYDGTLAHDGRVDASTFDALARLRTSGRRIVLVTGRRLDDLRSVCPDFGAFDMIVAENGGLLHVPRSRESVALAEAPPASFIEELRRRGVTDVAVGAVIVATWQPHAETVLETIRDAGLELQVIFNKGAVMVLPSGANKATGLRAALERLGLSAHNAVSVGDAENDHALLAACECGVAVANALPSLRERADLVTAASHGAGVAELAERLIATDLEELGPRLARHDLPLGRALETGAEISLPAYGVSLLVAGTSGAGKSTAIAGIGERLSNRGYQHVIIDPEGDYGSYERAIVLGDAHSVPTVEEVREVLAKPAENVVVNLVGLALALRPAFFGALLPALRELRARFGRPHWIVVEEAHHLVPASGGDGRSLLTNLPGSILVTVHPEHVAQAAVAAAEWVMAIGKTPAETIAAFSAARGTPAPITDARPLAPGEALVWRRGDPRGPIRIRPAPSRLEHRRHVRKYAEGDLGPESSFYFRGADGRLNLRAQNLQLFLQLGDGVDAATWLHHLRARDYSRWARDAIKDEGLAQEIAEIERAEIERQAAAAEGEADPAPSRAAVRRAIEERYTAPP
ncbi:MAG TPA: HAD-IIB family hydrolase [Polyangia bacterium]|nr:HAD-IIB family hydrolase [Polyangia bacterium]